jgi:hypothetical protein
MAGLPLPDESSFAGGRYDEPVFARRRQVLRETLAAFERDGARYRSNALENLQRWRASRVEPPSDPTVRVHPGDWGDVALALTRRYGETFAVLNMANAFKPGGAYVEGTAAQEENMFRRTDCHFSLRADQLEGARYSADLSALISGRDGRVLLDVAAPRTAIRGAEDRTRDDLGYPWLAADEVFPFYELRAAAVDLRGGLEFDPDEARRRIRAQLDTLLEAHVRYAVLGAFGCGAFHNPAGEVARLYRDELDGRRQHFDVLAFAIFHPGYGPDNYTPFANVLRG